MHIRLIQVWVDSEIVNGGPPGVLYELIVATAYYGVVAACIAEVRSKMLDKSYMQAR